MPGTDPNKTAGDRVVPPASKARAALAFPEAQKFSVGYMDAQAQPPNGTFGLGETLSAEDLNPRWPYWMCERDWSHLPAEIAGRVGDIEETVIAHSRCRLRNRSEETACYDTVSIHAGSGGDFHLLGLDRYEWRSGKGTADLPAAVLGECFAAADRHEIDLAEAPFYALDYEMANPAERRRLIARKIPYAILLSCEEQFRDVIGSLEEAADAFYGTPVHSLFDIHLPNRDTSIVNFLEVRDLNEHKASVRGTVREFVFEVPVGKDSHRHVLVGPAQSHALEPMEVEQARGYAQRCVDLALSSPADDLRIDEFHHPDIERFRQVMYMVEYGKGA